MGTELSGCPMLHVNAQTVLTIIPMEGLTQSLNVSVASACLLYRLAHRRRQFLGQGDLSEHEKSEVLSSFNGSSIN